MTAATTRLLESHLARRAGPRPSDRAAEPRRARADLQARLSPTLGPPRGGRGSSTRGAAMLRASMRLLRPSLLLAAGLLVAAGLATGCPATKTDPGANNGTGGGSRGSSAGVGDPELSGDTPEPEIGTSGGAPSAGSPRPTSARPRGRSLKVGDTAEPAPSGDGAPIDLTASDGTGLRLVRLDAKAVIEPPLAFTELQLEFSNPEPRVREGRFRITLPPSASISRFAMQIGDRWQEGEVVERQAARRAYEDFLHRRQDPALLEQQAGNEFTARVFPIPPNATKRLIISYSQELTELDAPYALPLRGLPKLDQLSIRAQVASEAAGAAGNLGGRRLRREVVEVDKTGWVPDRDFELPAPTVAGRLGLRHDHLVVARVVPLGEPRPDEIEGLAILVDTSASRALGFDRQTRLVEKLVDALEAGAGDVPLLVAAFDQEVVRLHQGTAAGFGAAELKALRDRSALGASDLEGALSWLRGTIGEGKARYPRVLIVTDGVATAGDTEGDGLRAAASALAGVGVQRVDALVLGGIRDADTLARLVTAELPRAGAVIDGDAPLEEVARRLTQQTLASVKVKVDGAKWVWPETLSGVQPGDGVLVYADLPPGAPFSVSFDGAPIDTARAFLDDVAGPLLERAWVRARIARLEHQKDTAAAGDADLRSAIEKQIVDLSTKHRVLSKYTALLVLETEADYARFGIDRRALADILTVGASGVELMARAAIAPPPPPPPPPRFGQMGTKGRGGQPPGADRETATIGNAAPAAAAPSTEGAVAADEPSADPAADEDAAPPADLMAEVEAEADGADDAREAAASGGAAPAPEPSPVEAAEEAPRQRPAAKAARAESRVSERRRDDRPAPRRRPPPRPSSPPPPPVARPGPVEAKKSRAPAQTGRLAEVVQKLERGDVNGGLAQARAWRSEAPGDVLALIALGEAAEKKGDIALAARAYGSLIDLFPSRADLRRFAGQRLERLPGTAALRLAADSFGQAAKQRPDHPSSHRLYAYALLRSGRPAEAWAAIRAGLSQSYPSGRFAGVDRILAEDAGLLALAWARAEPKRREAILAEARAAGASIDESPSVRFVLHWETDANDVDFHIHDGRGGHAYYRQKTLASGGALYADVTTGYGPECFTVPGGPKGLAYPYRLEAHYYRKGPMGYGMGALHVLQHDGRGGLELEARPFVVMEDGAYLDLGTLKGPLKADGK